MYKDLFATATVISETGSEVGAESEHTGHICAQRAGP